jgi:adenine-specific DNA-methyltransferase
MIKLEQSLSEARRQTLQIAIDARKSSAERNRLGQFATPNLLAIEIAHFVNSLIPDPHSAIRFADPSIGTGSFFSAALTVFGKNRLESATGIEIDDEFCETARNLWADFGLEVVVGDFTRLVGNHPALASPNVILANPPYVRHHHLRRENKVWLKSLTYQLTHVEVNGLAGLYVYFLLLATAWMEEHGIAAWLIPSEFMDVNYGVALKSFLMDRVTLLRVHRFDPSDVQFGDALVSSVVVVFRKSPPPSGHQAEFTFGGTMTEPHVRDRIRLEELHQSRKWTAFPRHKTNDRRSANNCGGPSLGDFFRVQRGIATGDNKFFVLKRAEAIQRGLPIAYLRPILPSPRHLKTTIIDAADDGFPLIDPQLCVIDCDLAEHVVEHRYPALWKYFATASALGVREGYLVGKRTPWYRQEQREPAPLLCTYMGRGSADKQPFRFIVNRSNAIGTNLYLMLYPQCGMASMLRNHPDRLVTVHDLLCEVTGNELRAEGRVYGGGLNKIEPSELSRISATSMVKQWPELAESVTREEANLFQGLRAL